MHQVVYSSAAVEAFSEAQLTDLLSRARLNNDRLGVTGMPMMGMGGAMMPAAAPATAAGAIDVLIALCCVGVFGF
jgi:hypothetical protein